MFGYYLIVRLEENRNEVSRKECSISKKKTTEKCKITRR